MIHYENNLPLCKITDLALKVESVIFEFAIIPPPPVSFASAIEDRL